MNQLKESIERFEKIKYLWGHHMTMLQQAIYQSNNTIQTESQKIDLLKSYLLDYRAHAEKHNQSYHLKATKAFSDGLVKSINQLQAKINHVEMNKKKYEQTYQMIDGKIKALDTIILKKTKMFEYQTVKQEMKSIEDLFRSCNALKDSE